MKNSQPDARDERCEALAACALVSWSRLALGHHYLSDVLAGTVIGATIAAFIVPTVF